MQLIGYYHLYNSDAVHQIIQYVVREANAVQRVLSAVKLAVAEGEVKISYLLSQEKPRRR